MINCTEFKSFLNSLVEINSTHFIVAYSGGLDSHVLLILMNQLREKYPELQLSAIHVNHNLNTNAGAWTQHCQSICDDLNISLTVSSLFVELKNGDSLEEVARNQRYRILVDQIQSENACLLMAHHQDDQAETICLQLLRGAGPKGLAGMPVIQNFSSGKLIRPLLNFSREQLMNFAREHELHWVEDDSNQDCRFSRNYLRHKVIPILQERWPSYRKCLSRSARHCAQTQELLEDLAVQDLDDLKRQSILNIPAIDAKLFSKLSLARQSNLLRYWIRRRGFRVPSESQLHAFLKSLKEGSKDKAPSLAWGNVELCRHREKMYLLDKENIAPRNFEAMIWNLDSPLILPNQLGTLIVTENIQGGIDPKIKSNHLEIRFRSVGEKIRLPGSKYRKSLKKLFQEWNVPLWQRSLIPLLYADDELISVIGYCLSEKIVITDQVGLHIQWVHDLALD